MGEVLQKFGMGVDLVCSFCKDNDETVSHVFLCCPWTWKLWGSCMSWWGVHSCNSSSIFEWWDMWDGLAPTPKAARARDLLFYAVA